jgi:prefoldin subunit 5
MSKQKTTPAKERIASSFKQLAAVSSDLNSAADELSKTISKLDEGLRGLKLGVSAWHQVAGNEDERDGSYWSRGIGYARVGNKWGIAIRKTWGNYTYDDYNEEEWLFADAPRWMCIESVGKLPDLFEDLIKRTEETTGKIRAKTNEANELAAAISAAAAETRPKAGTTR